MDRFIGVCPTPGDGKPPYMPAPGRAKVSSRSQHAWGTREGQSEGIYRRWSLLWPHLVGSGSSSLTSWDSVSSIAPLFHSVPQTSAHRQACPLPRALKALRLSPGQLLLGNSHWLLSHAWPPVLTLHGFPISVNAPPSPTWRRWQALVPTTLITRPCFLRASTESPSWAPPSYCHTSKVPRVTDSDSEIHYTSSTPFYPNCHLSILEPHLYNNSLTSCLILQSIPYKNRWHVPHNRSNVSPITY